MTEEAFKKAERIKKNIDELEDFMFWCSGRREGERKIPAIIIVLKRRMIAGLKSKEFTLPEHEQYKKESEKTYPVLRADEESRVCDRNKETADR